MDIFEEIKKLTLPKTNQAPPSQIPQPTTNKGLEAINQIRSSIRPTSFKPLSETSQFRPLSEARPLTTPLPAIRPTPKPQLRDLTRETIPTTFGAFKPIVSPIIKETPTPQLFKPTTLKSADISQQPIYKFAKAKTEPLGQAGQELFQAFNIAKKGEGLSGVERVLKGVSGVGKITSFTNELVVQPVWDSIKLGIKGLRTGQITDADFDKFIYTSGGEKGTIFEAFGTNEDEFKKQYGDAALQAARFLDFAPELIDPTPIGPTGKGGKVSTLAREVKLTGEAAEIAGKGAKKAKKEEITRAIANFEANTGEKVSKEAKDLITKTVDNPKNFINTLSKEATQKVITPQNEAFLIQEAKKYKTPEEFIKTQGTPLYHGTNADFKNFELNQPRQAPGNFKGVYFVDNIEEANDYGKVVKEAYLNFKNPLIGNPYEEYAKAKNIDFVKNRFDIKKDDVEKWIKENNFDGIIRPAGTQYNIQGTEYIALNVDTIKTKEQLTDIWKKSQTQLQTVQKTTPEVAKGLTTTVENIKASIKKGGGAVPPSGKIPLALPAFEELPTKAKKFPTTVAQAKGTAQEVKNILKDRIDLYSPIKNKDEFAKATKFVDENNIDDVIEYIKYADDPREVSYIGQALMSKLQKEKNFARVTDVLDIVSELGTKSGQAIQALSVWGRLTPEGALRKANSLVRQYNIDNNLTQGQKGFLKLTESQANKITEQANKLAKITDDYERLKEASKLQREIASSVPASLGTKIATVQTLAQLLNPKTFIRNVLGNAIFGTIDSVTQTFATPLDMAISLFTKKRTIAPASLRKQLEGGVEGFKKGMQEALEGADTSQLASKFDLPNASVFDSKIMQGLEKTLNVSLRAPDRAFYEATYKDTLEGLMKLNKVDKPTKEMIETAHYEALRRTFQDENRISKLFTYAKRALNFLGTKDRSFGLGDIILKYPKTPANLLVRALEYSPLNYVRAVMELAKPLMGQAFDQRAFVNNIARATVGTGMINLGFSLGSLGILTPRPGSDKDARTAQDLQGIKSYSFNISALKRYVLSGFDRDAAKPRVGDQLFSYDWAQPASIPLAIGVNLSENNGKVKEGTFTERALQTFGPLATEVIKSSDTLTEQSLLQGIQRLFGFGGLQQGLVENVLAIPQSFVPTILNQINQYTDNASRETYDPDLFKASYNQFAARVPLLATTLPQRVDVLGRPKERFPNESNTFFNVFFNPAFVDQIKNDPTLNEVITIFEQTGETTQFPRLVDKRIKVNGENRLLNTDELINYQRTVGQLSDNLIKNSLAREDYLKLPTIEKSLFIANLLSDANKVSKVQLFNDSPEGLSGRQELLLNNDLEGYINETLKNKQEQLRKEALKAQGISVKKIKLPAIKKPKKVRIPKPKKPKLKLAKVRIKKPKKRKTIKLQTRI